MSDDEPLIPKHGGYRNLKTFQLAQLIYDFTVRFCDRYIDKRSRTHDQMVQAARSGVQNIAEGSMASATSSKSELKLTGVARASLVELGLDYEDFLRQRGLPLWAENDPRRNALVRRRCKTVDEVAEWIKQVHDAPPARSTYREIAANAAIVLIGVTVTLLERQLRSQGHSFETEGGFTERLYRIRKRRRDG